MKRYHFSTISSTNDYARELLDGAEIQSDKHDLTLAVTAEHQTSGRGRKGRTWFGDYGNNIYCSVGIRHTSPPTLEQLTTYQAIGCLAARSAIVDSATAKVPEAEHRIAYETALALKYPNDIVVIMNCLPKNIINHSFSLTYEQKFRKISGVLVEHDFLGNECHRTIIGIGINVLQQSFASLEHKAISMALLGIDTNIEEITQRLLRYIELLLKQPTQKIHTAWEDELLRFHQQPFMLLQDKLHGSTDMYTMTSLRTDGRMAACNLNTREEVIIDNGDSILYE